jgi:hypothetical protein
VRRLARDRPGQNNLDGPARPDSSATNSAQPGSSHSHGGQASPNEATRGERIPGLAYEPEL